MQQRRVLVWTWILAGCAACAAQAPMEHRIAPVATGSPATPPPEAAAPDESQPEYWVERLQDPEQRSRAIDRLSIFYEDTVTLTNHDANDPRLRALVNALVEPLTELYVKHRADLGPKERETLVLLVSSFRDERAAPALALAFDSFADSGEGGREVKWAARAVRDLKLVALAPSLFRAFEATRPSTKEGAYYRDVNEALKAVVRPTWTGKLVLMVDAPLAPLGPQRTPESVAAYQDGIYRTITAAQLLGELRASEAVRPLIRLILDPARVYATDEALSALTQIGAPAAEAATALLAGTDSELLEYQGQRLPAGVRTSNPHWVPGAAIVGAIGMERGVDTVLAALADAKTPAARVPLLHALAMLPHSERTKTAFAQAFRQLPSNTEYQGESALIQLADAAALFFDPALGELVVERARPLRRDKAVKLRLAVVALKTANASNLKSAEGLLGSIPAERVEGPLKWEIDRLTVKSLQIRDVLELCAADTDCYLRQAALPENQGDNLVALVALYRVGQLSGPSVADALLAVLPSLEGGELRFVAAKILEHHFPKGSIVVADRLRAMVEQSERSFDRDRMADDARLRQAIRRLRARANG